MSQSSMHNKCLAFLIALALCLGALPLHALGQTEQLTINTSFRQLASDDQSAYLIAADDGLYQIDPQSLAAQGPLPGTVRTDQYPFVADGALWVIDKAQDKALPIHPDGKAGQAYALDITGQVAFGGDDWYLDQLQYQSGFLFFLLDGIGQAQPLLCRYDIAQQVFQQMSIPDIRAYLPMEAGLGLAICEEGGDTLLMDVNWQDGTSALSARLGGRWDAFYWDFQHGLLYAADVGGQAFVQLKDGKELVRAQSPYAAQAERGAVIGGQYVVMGKLGLHRPDFEAPSAQERVLRVLSGAVDEADIQFMQDHPGVRVEYLRSGAYEGMDFAVALITGHISYDVGHLSNNIAAAEALMDKGYCMDLSVSPQLQQLVNSMYAPFKDFAWRDGQLMMVPTDTRIEGYFELWEENLHKAGLNREQLPDTLEGLLDFLITWHQERGELNTDEDVSPIASDYYDDPLMMLVVQILQAYAAHYRRTGIPLTFDTLLLRRLLGKARQAQAAVKVMDGMGTNPPVISPGFGGPMPAPNTLIFPMTRQEHPLYQGFINGYIIDPRTEVPDLALAYVLHRMNYLPETTKVHLFDGKYTALERADYPEKLQRQLEQQRLLQQAVVATSDVFEQRNLQEQLDKVTNDIEHPSDDFRYTYTDAEIAFYQQEIVPNLELAFSDITNELSHDNVDTWLIIKRYVQGALDEEGFITALQNREHLRRLESQ